MKQLIKKILFGVNALRFRGRLVLGKNSIIYASARVKNSSGRREAIVIGDNSHLLGELFTFAHGGEVMIGDDCYVGEQSRIWSARSIRIGNRVLISHNVNIFDSLTHPISAAKRYEQFKEIVSRGHPTELELDEMPVVIENDVWVGCNAVILKGVRLGEGAIVGAGSVVTKNVPAWTVVAGNPAQVLREIPADER